MAKGKIVRMVRDRGFGFIRTEDGNEVFFHATTVRGGIFESLSEGEEVEFDIERDPRGRGLRAVNVELVTARHPG